MTWGAGGSSRGRTLEMVTRIKRETEIEAMAHLTCVGVSKKELEEQLAIICDAGITNVLALRGDPPRGQREFIVHPEGLAHASELVALAREVADKRGVKLCIGGACYPEGHPETRDLRVDLRHVKTKVDAGADFLITQLFFDNRRYFDFLGRARAAGIDVPVLPGIMPVTNVDQNPALHRHVRSAHSRRPLRGPARAPRRPRRHAAARRGLRHPAGGRAAARRRPRGPFLYFEPEHCHAGDPGCPARARTLAGGLTPMTMLALLLAAQAVNVPELPKDVPRDATSYTVTMMGVAAGQLAVWKEADRLRAFYQYNDRGRGPKTYSTLVLKDGLPIREEIEGNDYMKDAVRETFSVTGGNASWKSKAEQGTRKLESPAFYASMYGSPAEIAILARAALDRGGRLPLLPAGEARVEKLFDRTAEANGKSQTVSLYAVTGFDFSPDYFWLDKDRELFAVGENWNAVVRTGWEPAMPGLIKASQEARQERARRLAERLAHRPRGLLFFHDAAIFDTEFARIVPHMDVTVDGNRIVRVEPTGAVPAGAEVIEAAGKTLMPGLWDMHAHVSPNDGMLNLAAGVTTVRNLANDTDELLARRKRIEEGTELGTRIVMAGFMDGSGPYQGPTKVLVDDEKTGREWVDKYAALGMVQIKLYSSLKPELVAPIAEEAHRKGLRVSGHIPAGLTASEAVKLGYDEIQHVNFLVLNFMPDVKDTRTPARFLEPAKRAADLDLGSQEVRAFVQLLHDRHTTLDPTLEHLRATVPRPSGRDGAGLPERGRPLPGADPARVHGRPAAGAAGHGREVQGVVEEDARAGARALRGRGAHRGGHRRPGRLRAAPRAGAGRGGGDPGRRRCSSSRRWGRRGSWGWRRTWARCGRASSRTWR